VYPSAYPSVISSINPSYTLSLPSAKPSVIETASPSASNPDFYFLYVTFTEVLLLPLY
jgi:hypothetical protein